MVGPGGAPDSADEKNRVDTREKNRVGPRERPEETTMTELLVDFITSLDGYASADGWPGWWGLEGPEYLGWLEELEKGPEGGYTMLMGRKTYEMFLGFQQQTELPRCYDLCDAFVLPSGSEAWGLVVNEVMCAGRAVIVSDMVGAAPDLVRPGENGAIFRTDDVDDLARAIRDVLADPERLAAMGRRSLDIIERWSFEEDVAGLRQALATVCPGKLAGPGT